MLHKRSGKIGVVIGLFASVLSLAALSQAADSPAHLDAHAKKPQPWPGGVIPYEVSENIKSGPSSDYDWIARTNWIVVNNYPPNYFRADFTGFSAYFTGLSFGYFFDSSE